MMNTKKWKKCQTCYLTFETEGKSCPNCGSSSIVDAEPQQKQYGTKSNSATNSTSEEERGFDKYIIKVLGFLKLTSGTGLIGIGGFWFLYCILQFLFVGVESVMHQQVQETFFLQAQMGLLIVGIGILIRELKLLKNK